jgi:putative flippase GtrA
MDNGQVATAKTAQTLRLSAVWGFLAGQARAHKTLLKFMLVGLLGYLLYTATLFVAYDLPFPFMPDKHTSLHLGLFTHSDLRLLIGTILAAEVSITGGFFARDLWVFTDWPTADTPKWVKFVQYQAKSLVSTLGILTVIVNVLTLGAGLPHYIATPIGVTAAFAWNWLWESAVIWRRRSQG